MCTDQLLLLTLATVAAAATTLCNCQLYPAPQAEQKPQHWENLARQQMRKAEAAWRSLRYDAKSAILFLGDGMGVSSVTAGRILKGQLRNTSGEEQQLEFDTFPHVGFSKTYSVDRQTSDSAATATAFLGGVKANDATLGVNHLARRSHCGAYRPEEHDVASFLRLAIDQGKSAGIVTTTRITHATPAAAYANCVSRSWEDDTDRDADTSGLDTQEQRRACPDIAAQLADKAANFTVLIGGGRTKFLPKTALTRDHATNQTVRGTRSDGQNLIDRWRRQQAAAGRRASYVETTRQLLDVDIEATDSLLGLVAVSHLRYDADNEAAVGYKEPSLTQMTQTALRLLSKNPKGFVLLVEGGRIDHGHHGNQVQQALRDLVAFDAAVGAAKKLVKQEETLMVVTADHSHVFTLGHYGLRGQPVLLQRVGRDGRTQQVGNDRLPYTVVNYADGPGAANGAPRRNISGDSIRGNRDYRYPGLVPFNSESHAGEDVGIFASGPGAQLFHSVHEQSYIAHAIMKATCIGWYASAGECLRDSNGGEASAGGASAATALAAAVVLAAARL